MPRDDLQQIDLVDFTKGISSGYHTTAADDPTPDGYAREAGTWGCIAQLNGGLAPMPRVATTRYGQAFALGYEPQHDYETEWPTLAGDDPWYDRRIVVLDGRVSSPITRVPPLTQAVDASARPVDVFMVRQHWLRRRAAPYHPDSWWWCSNHPEYKGGADAYDTDFLEVLTTYDKPGRAVHRSRWTYGCGSIAETRTGPNDRPQYQTGVPVTVVGMGGIYKIGDLDTSVEGEDVAGLWTYPDVSGWDPVDEHIVTVDAAKKIPSAMGVDAPSIVFGHQNRLMWLMRSSGLLVMQQLNYHGGSYGQRPSTEEIRFMAPNRVYEATGPGNGVLLAMPEAPTGYGAVCSVNANSLILVKNQGGAVLVEGDVGDPSIVRLPGIPGVGGKANRPVMTDRGMVYGTVSGAWLWTGSDTAEHISPHLRDDFWLPEDKSTELREIEQLVGSFAFSYPYVYAPNNWVMDARTGGWFRYHPTEVQDSEGGYIFAFNEVDATGNLWAFRPSYRPAYDADAAVDPQKAKDRVIYAWFDRSKPRSSFQWQSQPLTRSRNRYLQYRQVTILASGHGVVTVTIKGVDGASQTVELPVNNDNMAMAVEDLNITTTDVEVTIASEATDPDDPAPTVHRVSLGYQETMSVGRNRAIGGT